MGVLNWDDAALERLPGRLSEKGMYLRLADIHSTWIHNVTREGWEPYAHKIRVDGKFVWNRHSNIRTDDDAISLMRETFRIP